MVTDSQINAQIALTEWCLDRIMNWGASYIFWNAVTRKKKWIAALIFFV